jgi:hypothetical protein
VMDIYDGADWIEMDIDSLMAADRRWSRRRNLESRERFQKHYVRPAGEPTSQIDVKAICPSYRLSSFRLRSFF